MVYQYFQTPNMKKKLDVYINKLFFIKYLVLFNLFDLSEMKSLSNVDLELMLIYCCNATYKFLVPNAEIS